MARVLPTWRTSPIPGDLEHRPHRESPQPCGHHEHASQTLHAGSATDQGQLLP